jgi:glycosyltransferase involved in cell wall biosynthesis
VAAAGIRSLASPRAWLRAVSIAQRLRRDQIRVAHLFFNDVAILMPWVLRLFGIRVVVARRDMGFWCTPQTLRVLRLMRPAVSMVVANIRPVKRIDVAIEAFAQIAAHHPTARLSIVGGGDATELQALAARHGIAQRVEFTGRVADAGEHIAGFSVALLTSESEGFSNALMEYMQAGKPVICTDSGGNSELVEDGRSGYLCRIGDSAAVARRLDQLLADPDARRRMGEAARQRVTTLCDPDVMLERHAVLYERLSAAADRRLAMTAESA